MIALGICGALPFRHAPPTEIAASGRLLESQSTLGEGVSLQVPGQAAVSSFQPATLRPVPHEEESEVAAATAVSPAQGVTAYTPQTMFRPPSLPDHYRPLFRPDASGEGATTHVVQPPHDPVPTSKPAKIHTIHDGDTLASLASRYLDDPRRAGEILDANREVLSDPELLPIGAKILIPRRGSTDVAVQSSRDANPPTGKLVPLPALGLHRGQ